MFFYDDQQLTNIKQLGSNILTTARYDDTSHRIILFEVLAARDDFTDQIDA